MSVVTSSHYQPVQSAETASAAGLSVRAVRDLAESINNYVFYCARFPLTTAHPDENLGIQTIALGTPQHERLHTLYAARDFGPQFDRLTYTIGHVRTAGTGSVAWNIYCSRELYQGVDGDSAVPFDTNFFSAGFKTATFSTTAGVHAFATGNALDIVRNQAGLTYITISSTPSDATTTARISALTISPHHSAR
ncbi:MAG: hypothetical protein V3W44_09615 [Dehalococcoidales bacterium]